MFVSQNGKLGAAERPTARGDHAHQPQRGRIESGLLCVGRVSRDGCVGRIGRIGISSPRRSKGDRRLTLDPLRRLLSRSRYDQLIVSHFKNTATHHIEHRSYYVVGALVVPAPQTTEHGWRHGVGRRVHPIIVAKRRRPLSAPAPPNDERRQQQRRRQAQQPQSQPKTNNLLRRIRIDPRFLVTARPVVLQGALIRQARLLAQVRQPLDGEHHPRFGVHRGLDRRIREDHRTVGANIHLAIGRAVTPRINIFHDLHGVVGRYRQHHFCPHIGQSHIVVLGNIKPLEVSRVVKGLDGVFHAVDHLEHDALGHGIHESVERMLELVVGPRVVLGPSAAAPGQKERRLGKLRPLPGKRTIAIHRRHAHPFDSNLSPFDEPIVEPLQPLRRTFPLREIEDALIGHVHRPVSLHRRQQIHLRAPIIRRQSFSGHAKGQEADYQQDGGEEEIRGVPTERVPQRTEQSSGLFRRARTV